MVLLAAPAAAQDVMALVRADRWAEADVAAAQLPDPVARKLVLYFRLLAPNAASAAEIAGFMATSPDWPLQATLARRRDEALAIEPDDAAAMAQCDQTPPAATAARLRCSDAFRLAGRTADAVAMLRRAWIDSAGDAAWEAHFLQFYNPPLTRDDQWQRFDRLAWTDTAAAQRQAARLDPADQARAAARLAFRRDDPTAAALLAAVPAAQRGDPALVFEQLRSLRRADQDDAALALWVSAGGAAERAAPPERLAAFWDERNLLARRRLRIGDHAGGAYAMAADDAQHGAEQIADAEFLAGFIALRRLKAIRRWRRNTSRSWRRYRRPRSRRAARITGWPAPRHKATPAPSTEPPPNGPIRFTASSRRLRSATTRRRWARASAPCTTPPPTRPARSTWLAANWRARPPTW